MKVLATRRYPGPAFDELADIEVRPLSELAMPRAEVEVLVVANEPIPLHLLPGLRLVANFGVGYDSLGVDALRERGIAVTSRTVAYTRNPAANQRLAPDAEWERRDANPRPAIEIRSPEPDVSVTR